MKYESDAYGNQTPTEVKTLVQSSEEQLSRAEFYQAAQAGIRPSRMFVVHSFEYGGEQVIIADNQRYSVIRTFQRNADELELYVESKVGDQSG